MQGRVDRQLVKEIRNPGRFHSMNIWGGAYYVGSRLGKTHKHSLGILEIRGRGTW